MGRLPLKNPKRMGRAEWVESILKFRPEMNKKEALKLFQDIPKIIQYGLENYTTVPIKDVGAFYSYIAEPRNKLVGEKPCFFITWFTNIKTKKQIKERFYANFM